MTTITQASRHIQLQKISSGLWKGTFSAMASPCEIFIENMEYSNEKISYLMQLVTQEAWRIEQKYSRYQPHSIVSQINQSQGHSIACDIETAYLLDYANQCYQLSNGLFDITSGLLRKAWSFKGQTFEPNQTLIDQLLVLVGWPKCQWHNSILTLPAGAEIDFGGIGKEYAVDKCLQLMCASTTDSATRILLNFGGDLAASGSKLNGEPWMIGLDSTTELSNKPWALYQGGIATSGDTFRYCLYQGQRLSHILNPATGWPVKNAPRTVTVLAEHCTLAGMLATFAMLHGDAAESFLETNEIEYRIQWN